jgi:hypothetical protein
MVVTKRLQRPAEIRYMPVERFLGNIYTVSGAQVNEPHVFSQCNDGVADSNGPPGEYVHPVAQSPEFPGSLPDIDAHAAGISGTQRAERTGVDTKHRNPERLRLHLTHFHLAGVLMAHSMRQVISSAPPMAANIQFDRRGNVYVSVINTKSQITNNKQITMTKIQNVKPVWVIGYCTLEFICILLARRSSGGVLEV